MNISPFRLYVQALTFHKWRPVTEERLLQTRSRTQPSYKNKYAFLKKLDRLPTGPEWTCDEWDVVGELLDEDGKKRIEPVELWRRNPVECIRELLGNPDFKEYLRYAPEKLFADADGTERIYSEMWTGDWWWDTQVSRDTVYAKL